MTVELQRLLASAGDGHTLLFPFALKKLPVMLWWFDDGVFIVDAKNRSRRQARDAGRRGPAAFSRLLRRSR